MFNPLTLKASTAKVLIDNDIHIPTNSIPGCILSDLFTLNTVKNLRKTEVHLNNKWKCIVEEIFRSRWYRDLFQNMNQDGPAWDPDYLYYTWCQMTEYEENLHRFESQKSEIEKEIQQRDVEEEFYLQMLCKGEYDNIQFKLNNDEMTV